MSNAMFSVNLALKIPSFKASKLLESPVPKITKSGSSQTAQPSMLAQMALQNLPQLATVICRPDRPVRYLSHPLKCLSTIFQLRDFTNRRQAAKPKTCEQPVDFLEFGREYWKETMALLQINYLVESHF